MSVDTPEHPAILLAPTISKGPCFEERMGWFYELLPLEIFAPSQRHFADIGPRVEDQVWGEVDIIHVLQGPHPLLNQGNSHAIALVVGWNVSNYLGRLCFLQSCLWCLCIFLGVLLALRHLAVLALGLLVLDSLARKLCLCFSFGFCLSPLDRAPNEETNVTAGHKLPRLRFKNWPPSGRWPKRMSKWWATCQYLGEPLQCQILNRIRLLSKTFKN